MSGESSELWSAMKNRKYRDTFAELRKVKADESTDLPAFMSSVLQVVAKAVHAEAGTLWYYARFSDGRIHAKASYGGSDLKGISLVPGEGVAGKVIEDCKGVLIADCQKDARWSGKADKNTGFVTKTMICEPILDGDQCFGCIQLINRTDGNFFDEEDSAFLRKLCGEISDIFREHSNDFMIGKFTKSGEGNSAWLSAIGDMTDYDEMMKAVHKVPAYAEMGNFKAWLYDRYCRKLWKLMH